MVCQEYVKRCDIKHMRSKMDIIRGREFQRGLDQTGRVYLCGDLSDDNISDYIQTAGFEMGISEYKKYQCERPHYHSFNIEYNYMICGTLKVFIIRERKEYLLKTGDLFVIQTNEPYITKAQTGTKVLFAKVPGGNDKVLTPLTQELERWGQNNRRFSG